MTEIRKIILPGEVVGSVEKNRAGHGTYVDDGKIVSKFLGILKESRGYVSVIQLSGVYAPKPRDNIIGIITSTEKVGWTVDINSPREAFLRSTEAVSRFVDLKRTDITRFFDVGDVIYTQISYAGRGNVQLTMKAPICRKLKGGVIVRITPSKVPRLIGKKGSMVNMIKEKTKTMIRVGQNGVVWISGNEVEKAIKVVKMIDEKSHMLGLTEEIEKFLS